MSQRPGNLLFGHEKKMRNLSALIFSILLAFHLILISHSEHQGLDKRDIDTVSGDGIDDLTEEVCSSLWSIENPFTSISQAITDEIASCTSSGDLYEEYSVAINSQDRSFFTVLASDLSVLFIDHFKSNTSYDNVTVETLCTSCDPNVVELRLNITVQTYNKRLLPHGDTLSDDTLKGEDDGYMDAVLDSPFAIPVYDETYNKAYIITNGLVTFEAPQTNWYPEPFPYGSLRVPVLAPYWTDITLNTSSSAVLNYNTYHRSSGNRAREIVTIATKRINDFIDQDFIGQWLLVATWSNVAPYINSSITSNENITFQLVLVTNFTHSYALYIYDAYNIDNLISSIVIGHSGADLITYYNLEFNSSDSFLHMDTEIGNTGSAGQWVYDVSGDITRSQGEDSCIEWVVDQADDSTLWTDHLPYCPCTKQQATSNWLYSFDEINRDNCAIYLPSDESGTVECCYGDDGELVGGSSEEGGSGYLRYHPVYSPDKYQSEDRDSYDTCCVDSYNCEAYRIYRPAADCSDYKAPITSFAWGDPHFETFDGKTYTFNGVGEFVLFNSDANELRVQVRLEQYLSFQASVITSLAVKNKQIPTIQLELDVSNKYVLYFDGIIKSEALPAQGKMTAFTANAIYQNNSLSEIDFENDDYILLRNINDTYVIVTGSGAAIRIGRELTFLYCIMEISADLYYDSTEGLWGYFDNDPSNDFYLPDGSTMSETSTESELFEGFGMKWHISESDSLFTYTDGESYNDYNDQTLTFTPNFGTDSLDDNPALKTQAQDQCEGDYSCLYDTAQTEDITVGLATLEIRQSYNNIKRELENFPPYITGSSFNVIVNAQEHLTVSYSASDPDNNDTTDITVKEPIPTGVSINSTGHYLSVNITSLPSSPLYITSSDVNGTVSTQRLTVLFCDCKNNGTCVEDLSFTPLDANGHYQLPCDCPEGQGGLYCEEDYTGCGNSPCPSFTTCMEDESISDKGYKCVDCQSGYGYDSNGKCIDNDECLSGKHDCSQQCVNTDGNYECSCDDGFRLSQNDSTTCNDINECAELTDNCGQICTNVIGGFNCSCETNWNQINHLCGVNEQHIFPGSEANCSGVDNVIVCACPVGKQYKSAYCEDCPSGKYGYKCLQTCNCLNGGTCDERIGCVCASGYSGYDCGTEINDYSPVFSDDTISVIDLPEALPSGSAILFFEASDDDAGPPGEVSYSILDPSYNLPSNVSNGLNVFTVDPSSGLLSTVVPLADVSEKEFLVMVEAKDGGIMPNKKTHLLYISVSNKTLPEPRFSSSSFSEYLHENTTEGSVVATDVVCAEVDSINSRVVDLNIKITSGNTNSSFKIVDNKIYTSESLDFEKVKRYDLQITCTNALNISAVTNLTIVILNINDNPFKFNEIEYTIDVFENATKNDLLETFEASDADYPDNVIEYYLTSTEYNDIFLLNVTTGELSVGLIRPFDRETRDNYTLEVSAHLLNMDSSIKHTVVTQVDVNVKDINDFTPLFSESVYIVTNLSQSNVKGDTVVVTSAIDKDLGLSSEFVFTIQNNSYFNINPSTGEVFIDAVFLDKGTYKLYVYATDSGSPSLTGTSVIDIVVAVTPNDIHFGKNKYVFNVTENGAIGELLGVTEATLYDIANDSISTSELKYTMADSLLPFILNPTSGAVTVKTPLDYEYQDMYEFTVTASYPTHPSVPTATATVQVIVEDMNDNSPVFVPSSYSKLLYVDSEVGTTVSTVHASDKDEDGKQIVMYSLTGDYGPFMINSTSGVIVLGSILELPLDYHFKVTATDSGQPSSLSNETTVHVTVTRRGAIHPLLTSTQIIFTVSESVSSPGTVVGTVKAFIDGNVTIAAEHGIGFRLRKPAYSASATTPFEIGTHSGQITTAAHAFDYEAQDEYVFYVELFDVDTDTMYDSAPVTVKVLDVNDETPVFEETHYSSSLSPSTPAGTVLLTVSASDSDGGDVVYSVSPAGKGFHVDAFTGEVSVVNITQDPGSYELVITATDQGNPQLSSSVNVYLTVTSHSQNISFTQDQYVFNVVEGTSMNTVVGSIDVSAIDGVSEVDYNEITFELFPEIDCIDNNGRDVIVGCTNLDRETQSVYNSIMKATHGGSVSGQVSVTVYINDTNDNAPVFTKDVYTVLVSTNFNSSNTLLSPVTIDNDLHSITTYSIDTSNPDIFSIDVNTGELSMIDVPVNASDYSFTITATDAEDASLFSTAIVLVSVYKPGPKALELSLSSLSHSIPENSPGETKIGVLQLLAPTPVDPSKYIGLLDFEILSGDNIEYFHIVDSNATLTLLNNFLDRETSDTHIILVQAAFKTFDLTAQAYVTIHVTDTNDNAPTFTKGVYAAELPNNSTAGALVTTVSANDKDIDQNANITYSILGNQTDYNIDSGTGYITTAVVIPPGTIHQITVVATDQGTPQMSSTAIVSIVVAAAIPDSISFESDNYKFSFVENNSPGSHVGTVSIAEDISLLEDLVYEFASPEDVDNLDLFHLDAVSGNISVLFSIDREDFEVIEATVTAKVPSQPSLTSTASIEITILDENDYAPSFSKNLYQVDSLTAGSLSSDTVIVTVDATDDDKGENGTVSYTLSNEDDFTIDGDGNIKVKNTDLESGTYKIIVTATDSGTDPLTGTAVVLITINVPIVEFSFDQNSFAFSVPENNPPGSVLSQSTVSLKELNLDYVSSLQYSTSNDNFILIGNNTNPDMYSTVSFDYEADSSSPFLFTVTATAQLKFGGTKTATTAVTVTVSDENDNVPQFTDLPDDGIYVAKLYEDKPDQGSTYNEKVIQLGIEDIDSGANGDIKCSFLNHDDDVFRVDNNGWIRRLNAKIDREETPFFLLTVIATDEAEPFHSNSASVYIDILDLNDNAPSLLNENDYYYVTEEQPVNSIVFTLFAHDPDKGENGTVMYELSDNPYFGINSTSGEVYNKIRMDYEDGSQDKEFDLTLTLSDGGTTVQSTTTDIVIVVLNVPGDHSPEFVNIDRPVYIIPTGSQGSFVTHIDAIDKDGDKIEFEIDSLQFSIDDKGNITKADNTVLDLGPILVQVTITDDSAYKLTSSTEITVTVVEKIVVEATSSSVSTTSTAHRTQSVALSTSTSTEPTSAGTIPPSSGGGIIGFAIAGILGVLFVIAVIVIVILLVLIGGKRRERIKSKRSDDPYKAAEENWILRGENINTNTGNKKKDKKSKKKSNKASKTEELELDRKSSLVDSSAYETMFEDDIDLLTSPYQADSEDNPSGFNYSQFSKNKPPLVTKPTAGSKKTTTKTTPKPAAGAGSTSIGLNKPTPTGSGAGGAAAIKRPIDSTKVTTSKPTASSAGPSSSATSNKRPSPAGKSNTTKTTATSRAPSTSKPKTTPQKSKPPAASSNKKGVGSKGPPGSRPSSSGDDGASSPLKRRSRNKRPSIDSSVSEFDDYLNSSAYGTGAPMGRGEHPSEYDIFLKPDESGKPPPGTRPSLDNLVWNKL